MEVKLLRADEEGRQYGQLSQENTTYATRAPLLHLVRNRANEETQLHLSLGIMDMHWEYYQGYPHLKCFLTSPDSVWL